MSLTRNIARHTAIQVAGKVLGTLIALITVSFMLRYLGREGFGEYTTIVTYLSVFAIFGDLGLYLVTTREISSTQKAEAQTFLASALGLKLAVAAVLMLLAMGTVWLIPAYSTLVKVGVSAGALSYFFIMATQVLVGVFQKHFAMHKLALAEVISRLTWLVGVVLAVWQGWSLITILLLISFAQAVQFVVLYLFARGYYQLRPTFDWQQWKGILIVAAPLAFSAVFNTIYFKVDTLILRWVDTAEAVGIYGAAYKVLENLVTFAAIFSGIMLPVLVRGVKSDKKLFKEMYQRGIDVVAIFMAPLVVGTLFLAEPIIVLFGDAEFAMSAGVLRVLIFAVAAIFFAHLTGNAVVALGKEKIIMWLYLAIAVVALIGYVIFIPMYSYTAAAVITVLAECTVFVSTSVMVWKFGRARPALRVPLTSLVAAGAMALVFWLAPGWEFVSVDLAGKALSLPTAPFWWQAIGGVVMYAVVLVLLRGVSLSMIREVVSLRKID